MSFRAFIAMLLSVAAGGSAHAASSLQAAYDAAQSAFDKDDWATAAAGFEPLLPRDPKKPLNASQAVIAMRLGASLVKLGRAREARLWLSRAIDGLPSTNSSDLAIAYMTAGTAARFDFDGPAAIAAYEKALALMGTPEMEAVRINASVGLAIAGATSDPARAAAALDAVLANPSNLAKQDLAVVEEMRARAAMNAGDLATAKRWIDQALSHSGGSQTTRVSVNQVEIRGDAAIISQLRGDSEATRQYLTFTGAGHLKSTEWIGRYEGELPVCGQDGDIRPDDSAVILFSIRDDGRIAGAQPVYASRPGEVGWAFARAMSSWRWDPSLLKEVEPFWRQSVRFEVRCISRPTPDALAKRFEAQFTAWLSSIGVKGDWTGSTPADAPADDIHQLPNLIASFRSKGTDRPLLERVYRALDAAHAPAVAYAVTADRMAHRSTGSIRDSARARADALAASLPFFQQRYPAEAVTAWLQLEQALALEDARDFAPVPARLDAVLATPLATLPGDDPLRRVALLHMAMVKRRLGDASAMEASAAANTLTVEQCSLIDTHPIPQSVSISSQQFPLAALAWRFEGHVEVAYDITADGSVSNVRTILAYPPFIFGKDTERAAAKFRYVPPMIGDKPVGCVGETQKVNYRIP